MTDTLDTQIKALSQEEKILADKILALISQGQFQSDGIKRVLSITEGLVNRFIMDGERIESLL